ncbi:hypothetical protein NL676_002788 [Syzygium grande]|nr:hypothetical protein NL676_002788 [Syzygium grande]
MRSAGGLQDTTSDGDVVEGTAGGPVATAAVAKKGFRLKTAGDDSDDCPQSRRGCQKSWCSVGVLGGDW